MINFLKYELGRIFLIILKIEHSQMCKPHKCKKIYSAVCTFSSFSLRAPGYGYSNAVVHIFI